MPRISQAICSVPPDDVRLAARRFGFKRRTNVHPVEGIDDPRLAVAALSIAFLELDDYPSAEQRSALLVRLQSVYDISQNEAEEMAILGRWFVSESGGPSQAITRAFTQALQTARGRSDHPADGRSFKRLPPRRTVILAPPERSTGGRQTRLSDIVTPLRYQTTGRNRRTLLVLATVYLLFLLAFVWLDAAWWIIPFPCPVYLTRPLGRCIEPASG